jgi:hypothetical protein
MTAVVAAGLWAIGLVLSWVWPSTPRLQDREGKHFPFSI